MTNPIVNWTFLAESLHVKCLIWLGLVTRALGTKCAYRGSIDDPYDPENGELPVGFGIRECRWGCCWQNHHDVCCPFPQEVVVVAVVSVIASLLVISAIVILICYMVVRKRKDFHGEFKDLLLCCRPLPENPTVVTYTASANHRQEEESANQHQDHIELSSYTPQRNQSQSSVESDSPPPYSKE